MSEQRVATRKSVLAVAAAGVTLALAWAAPASAAVTSFVAGATLTVTSDAADAIAITCSGGFVKMNGFDPGTGPALCLTLTTITVTGGPGANTIDVSGVMAADFPAVPVGGLTAYVGGDNDTLFGDAAVNYLYGNAGSDWLVGFGGADYLYGGSGDDNLNSADGMGGRRNYCQDVAADAVTANAGDINSFCESITIV